MKRLTLLCPSSALLIAVLFMVALSHPSPSYAYHQCQYTYEALLDTDNNTHRAGMWELFKGLSPHILFTE
jgi:hypothetical protein